MNLFQLTGAYFNDEPCQNTEHDTVCDRIRKRHHQECQISADSICQITVELHFLDGRSHKETNDYQSRSCGKAWNSQEDR